MATDAPIRLIAFDFFGTLVRNNTEDWHRALSLLINEQQLPIEAPELWTEWRKYEINFRKTRTDMISPDDSPPFRSYREAWRDAFRDAFASLGMQADADAAATRCVDEHRTRVAFPEAHEALTALEALGSRAPMAILSNADDRFLQGSIDHNGWVFDTVLSSEQVRAYKPDPRAFAALCSLVGVEPGQVLYVGDSPYDDAHGAKLAGMRTVLITREPPRPDAPGQTPPPDAATLLAPNHEIESLAELLPIVLSEIGRA
jgi:2-haloacid dehalogenase